METMLEEEEEVMPLQIHHNWAHKAILYPKNNYFIISVNKFLTVLMEMQKLIEVQILSTAKTKDNAFQGFKSI
jgi:hypothetical protein